MPVRLPRPALAALALALPLGGCLTIGADRLSRDEIDYSRALAISQNEQTLLNIVRLRYAEAPTFLDLTQVISGYQAQQNVNGSFEAFPTANASTYLGGGGSLQLQESPTFTYAPVTGEQFATTFLRPLPPATVLPLALGGVPIDIVLGMVVQSIDGADNAQVLSGSDRGASPDFEALLRDLRVLQDAGLLDVQSAHPPDDDRDGKKGTDKASSLGNATVMVVRDSDDAALEATVHDARRLLGLPPDRTAFEIVYGRETSGPHRVAMLTRSLLTTLGSVAFAIDVPPADVTSGRTMPTVATASAIRIHSGASAPADAFVTARYDGTAYWIRSDDFRSKLAFGVLQELLALAEAPHAPGAVVTVPAG